MTKEEFVKEFGEEDFPQIYGRWLSIDDHDPPFSKTILRQMKKNGLIDVDETTWKYRLTFKAYNVAHGWAKH